MDNLEPISAPPSLGEHLLAAGKLNPSGLERAQRLSAETGERFEAVLTRLGLMTERDLARELSKFLGHPMISADEFPSLPVPGLPLSARFLKQARLIPVEDRPEGLVVAMADPQDGFALKAVEFAVGKPALPRVACPAEIDSAFERLFGGGRSEFTQIVEDAAGGRAGQGADAGDAGDDVDRVNDTASAAPVIRLVNLIILQAVEARASDIHFEPMDGELRVRYRIDGVLHGMDSPPSHLRAAVISRIKIMARLNIAERRLAQDGRIRIAVRGNDIDFRVSTTPTIHGESVVLRILDRGSVSLSLPALGYGKETLGLYRALMKRPHGIILVTGPTGSGKTTSLYAALMELNTPERKILTIEDPIEYQIDGVNQVQVMPQIGHSFASALRSFLRQDPDVMMVGEIRDLETAEVAVQAALTGHVILATLHTNDAASAVTRLLDMGVEDYLLTSTINGLVAQRLVRLLCTHCREPYEALPEFAERMELRRYSKSKPEQDPIVLYRAVGCARCNDTGYFGRTAIVEVLAMSDAIRQLVLQHAEMRLIQKTAIGEGMQTMYRCGMAKALDGLTTIDEVLRVIRDV